MEDLLWIAFIVGSDFHYIWLLDFLGLGERLSPFVEPSATGVLPSETSVLVQASSLSISLILRGCDVSLLASPSFYF